MTAESPQSGESAPAPGPSAVAQAISGCGADNDANFGADQFRRDQGKPAVVETDPKVRGWDWTLFAWFFAASVLGFAAIVGAYLVIGTQFESRGRFITAADRITASFAVATALGALAALVVSIRKQTLAERVAQGHVAAAFTERFRSAAQQLGAAAAAERMAGVYAMAALADEYPSRRQQCVDVLCGYLRLPFDPDTDHFAEHSTTRTTTDSGVTQTEHWAPASQPFDLQVRATILYLIRMHTHRERDDQTPSWSHLNFDFQGVHFVDADFSYCQFSGATTLFNGARFTGKAAAFTAAMFDGASASFEKAEFICSARFGFTQFRGGEGNFEDAIFHDESVFTHARFELEDVEVRWGWGASVLKAHSSRVLGQRSEAPP